MKETPIPRVIIPVIVQIIAKSGTLIRNIASGKKKNSIMMNLDLLAKR